MKIYTHAKDYLLELAHDNKTRGWMKELIIRIVNSNGKLTDNDIDAIFQLLINNSACLSVIPSIPSETSEVIRLVKLVHHRGVNALAPEQVITFSNDITLLYGPNGSGKSSYFRVLNEIVGGSHQSEVRSNIYNEGVMPIDVELNYTLSGVNHTIQWDGSQRSIEPLNLVSVFDTSYTNSFLEKRSADAAIVAPYGLHLFSVLTDTMDKLKGKLSAKIVDLTNSLPNIDVTYLLDDTSRVVTQRYFIAKQKTYITSRYEITDENRAKLEELTNNLKELEATNYEDKVKIVKSEESSVESLLNYLKDLHIFFSEILVKSADLLSKLAEARKENNLTKGKIEILNEIDSTDSEEWKKFILAGEDYSSVCAVEEDVCPYCRQPLVNKAKDLIKAYKVFLSDKSETQLKNLLVAKESMLQALLSKNVDFIISEQLKSLLMGKCSSKFVEDINAFLTGVNQLKAQIREAIIQEDKKALMTSIELQPLILVVAELVEQYNVEIRVLRELQTQKDSQIAELKLNIQPLKENLAIHEQRGLFEDWFAKVNLIQEYDNMQSGLSTRSISLLAKTASQTLVTENLKQKFEEELKLLGLNKLQVFLSDVGASRGQSYMRIQLKENITAKEILSEGEQKGVALALFIAERRMQKSKNPIILDDPVNSLDHYIIASLVERLAHLGNQIIIFSHNLLLQTSLSNLKSLHLCGVNQLSSCRKTGRHLFEYRVQSQGRDYKGVILELKQDNVANNLMWAKRKLDTVPFSEYGNVASILRHTIELLIDEKIFNNQVPLKYHGKKNNIQWEQLKSLNPDSSLIDTLSKFYSRLSGGDLHLGVENQENPIEYDELNDMYNVLSAL